MHARQIPTLCKSCYASTMCTTSENGSRNHKCSTFILVHYMQVTYTSKQDSMVIVENHSARREAKANPSSLESHGYSSRTKVKWQVKRGGYDLCVNHLCIITKPIHRSIWMSSILLLYMCFILLLQILGTAFVFVPCIRVSHLSFFMLFLIIFCVHWN